MRITSLIAGAVIATSVACEYPFGPDEGEVRPQLDTLLLGRPGSSLDDGGILFIDAVVVDTSFRLQPRQRVPVEVVSTSGDVEDIGLYRMLCPAREITVGYTCFTFNVTFAGPYDLDDIRTRVESLGGRVDAVGSRLVSIVLFDPGKVLSTARAAESWPGVAYTWTSVPACMIGVLACVDRSRLQVPVPVDHAPPVPGDGILQVQAMDTVFVRYAQPDTTFLTGQLQ